MNTSQNELYHYGRKGMKWGKKIFSKEELKELIDKRLSGDYYKTGAHRADLTAAHLRRMSNDYKKRFAHVVNKDPGLRTATDNQIRDRKLARQTSLHVQQRKAEDRASYMVGQYKKKSVKAVPGSAAAKAKKWIKSKFSRKIVKRDKATGDFYRTEYGKKKSGNYQYEKKKAAYKAKLRRDD